MLRPPGRAFVVRACRHWLWTCSGTSHVRMVTAPQAALQLEKGPGQTPAPASAIWKRQNPRDESRVRRNENQGRNTGEDCHFQDRWRSRRLGGKTDWESGLRNQATGSTETQGSGNFEKNQKWLRRLYRSSQCGGHSDLSRSVFVN